MKRKSTLKLFWYYLTAQKSRIFTMSLILIIAILFCIFDVEMFTIFGLPFNMSDFFTVINCIAWSALYLNYKTWL